MKSKKKKSDFAFAQKNIASIFDILYTMKNFPPVFKRTLSVVLLFFIVCGTAFVSAFSSAVSTETSASPSPKFTIYFVSTCKSRLEAEAISLAKDVSKNGGSGYIWKEGEYFYVISSAYENKNDADLVCAQKNAQKINCEVFEIAFPLKDTSCPLSSPEAKSTYNAGTNIFRTAYKILFDISVSLDTSIYSETTAMLELNSLEARVGEVIKNFEIVFKDTLDAECSNLLSSIKLLNDSISNISEEKETPLLSQIRYAYCEDLCVYFDFLSKID